MESVTNQRFTTLQTVLSIAIALVAVVKIILLIIIPRDIWIPTAVKIAAGIILILLAVSGKKIRKNSFSVLIFVTLLVFLVADILMKLWFIAGAVLFGIGHILLAIAFLKKNKPTKTGWILWIAISVVIGAVIFLFLPGIVPKGYLGCAGMTLYAFAIVLMVVCAVRMQKRLAFAAYAFLLSDFLLVPDMLSKKFVWCHCISTALFYLALWLICRYLILQEENLTSK